MNMGVTITDCKTPGRGLLVRERVPSCLHLRAGGQAWAWTQWQLLLLLLLVARAGFTKVGFLSSEPSPLLHL